MAYEKKIWDNVPDPSAYEGDLNVLPRFDKDNMNRIEQGIEDAHISLDGKAPSGHGLGDRCTPYTRTNFKSIMKYGSGFYQVDSADDTPTPNSPAWKTMLQLVTNKTEGVESGVQMIMPYDQLKDPEIWFRTVSASTPGDWVEIIHTGNASGLVKTLGTGISIPDNANLNSYTTVGNYVCSAMVTAGTLSNCPVSTAFYMTVSYANGTKTYLRQDLVEIQRGLSYYRSYDGGTKSWGVWQSVYSTNNKPKPEDIGVVQTGTYMGNSTYENSAYTGSVKIPCSKRPKSVMIQSVTSNNKYYMMGFAIFTGDDTSAVFCTAYDSQGSDSNDADVGKFTIEYDGTGLVFSSIGTANTTYSANAQGVTYAYQLFY